MSYDWDVILIDDDIFQRSYWENCLAQLKVLTVPNLSFLRADLLPGLNKIRDTHTFLDYELNDGSDVRDNIVQLHGLGFRRVYLCTSYSPMHLADIKGVEAIVGKSPPDWLFNLYRSKMRNDICEKLSIEQRIELLSKMSEEDRLRFNKRFKEYFTKIYDPHGPILNTGLPEKILDTWERAIFEGVSDSELSNRIKIASEYFMGGKL